MFSSIKKNMQSFFRLEGLVKSYRDLDSVTERDNVYDAYQEKYTNELNGYNETKVPFFNKKYEKDIHSEMLSRLTSI